LFNPVAFPALLVWFTFSLQATAEAAEAESRSGTVTKRTPRNMRMRQLMDAKEVTVAANNAVKCNTYGAF